MSQLKKKLTVIQEKIFAQHVRCANPFAGALCVCWREWVMSATKQRNCNKSGDDRLLMIMMLIMIIVMVMMTLMMMDVMMMIMVVDPPPQRSKDIAAT